MRVRESGYTLIELVVALAIISAISLATFGVTYQVFGGTKNNNDRLSALHQIQNAGAWISRDAQAADTISADNLTAPDFLVFNWTQWEKSGTTVYAIYHSARYYFDNLDEGIGRLKRSYSSSAGASAEITVGVYLYYNLSDNTTSSIASYLGSVTSVRLTAIVGGMQESREYRIKQRPDT